jgi:hypothetical protein
MTAEKHVDGGSEQGSGVTFVEAALRIPVAR